MELNNFIKDAIRTESTIDSVKVNPEFLAATMAIHIASGNMLDQVKKHVFYGKEYDLSKIIEAFKNIVEGLDVLNATNPQTAEEVDLPVNPRIFHAVVGAATEATELLEALDLSGEELDNVNIGEEFGDINWYQAIAMDELGLDWSEVLETIISKLKQRYPEKFDSEKAIDRDLDAEREILNNIQPE